MLRPRDFMKLGQMFLSGGVAWLDIVSPRWVVDATRAPRASSRAPATVGGSRRAWAAYHTYRAAETVDKWHRGSVSIWWWRSRRNYNRAGRGGGG